MKYCMSVIAAIVLLASGLAAQEQTAGVPPASSTSSSTTAKQEAAVPPVADQRPAHYRTHRARVSAAAEQKAAKQIPSIIQSELDRSRAEEKQTRAVTHAAPVVAAPAPVQASTSMLWPVILSVLIAGCATAGIVYGLFLRKRTTTAAAAASRETPQSFAAALTHAPQPESAAGAHDAPIMPERVYEPEVAADYPRTFGEDDLATLPEPYAVDEDVEMPEAALTMNLLNKKRDTKKELIQEVMRRVQRKERPQQIAEALRVGIGEVQLAMTLAKMKR